MNLAKIILAILMTTLPALGGAIFGFRNLYDRLINVGAYLVCIALVMFVFLFTTDVSEAMNLYLHLPFQEFRSAFANWNLEKSVRVGIIAILAILPFSLLAHGMQVLVGKNDQTGKKVFEHFSAAFCGMGRGACLLALFFYVLESLAPTNPWANEALTYFA